MAAPPTESSSILNRPLLLLGLLTLLTGTWAGLLRIGWAWPALVVAMPANHGPLMVSVFLGLVICLERAVALAAIVTGRAKWLVYAPALLAAAGGLLLVLGMDWWPILLLVLASAGLLFLTAFLWTLHPASYVAVMAAGALLWLVGNGLWLNGSPLAIVTFWWAGFLLFTIAGERLELNQMLALSSTVQWLLLGMLALFTAGLLLLRSNFGVGMGAVGLSMVLTAIWLFAYDVIRRRFHLGGQVRFTAVCLLSGYGWLAIAGLLAIFRGGTTAGFAYDAVVHAFYLGFAFSMIFGHAPIVFPAVTGRRMVFSKAFYGHVLLLNISLILRLYADLAAVPELRQWAGLLNAATLLLFLANTVIALARSARREQSRR